MKKNLESKKKVFFKEIPQNLYKLINSVKIFEPPLNLLTSTNNKKYAEMIINKYGVTEKGIHKIIKDSFDPDVIVSEVIGKEHELSGKGEAIFKGYTKALNALEKMVCERMIIEDRSYHGVAYGKRRNLREALSEDIEYLKKKRQEWANLFSVHLEIKEEFISKTTTGMFTNQAFNLFLYIEKCRQKKGGRVDHKKIYELISELFMKIYDHPLFNASKKFTPIKIKGYCDNVAFHSKKKKTSLRKSIESL